MMKKIFFLSCICLFTASCHQQGHFDFPHVNSGRNLMTWLTEEDKQHLDSALSYTENNKEYSWYNRQSQISFKLQAGAKYYPLSDSIRAQPCRVFQIKVQHGSFVDEYHKRACRKQDKTWTNPF